jgi:two-component system, LuxR family, response regulator FixJ
MSFDKTVLVMDDDLSTVKGIERLANPHGINVLSFSNRVELQHWADRHAEWLTSESTQLCLVLDVKYVSDVLADLAWEGFAKCPIVCVSRDAAALNKHQNLVAGLFSYLEKPFTLQSMLSTLEAALLEHSRQKVASRVEDALRHNFSRLTKRELEVCELVVQGLPNKNISEMLSITIKTVKAHRAKVMSKTCAGSLAELIRTYDLIRGLNAVNATSHATLPAAVKH